jgi:hypothetical protein
MALGITNSVSMSALLAMKMLIGIERYIAMKYINNYGEWNCCIGYTIAIVTVGLKED